MEGRGLLEEGIRWKVGCGTEIRVWKDPWLPMPHRFRPVTRNLFLENNLKVADLILDKPRRWNKDLIAVLFQPRDADLIFQIPLCAVARADRCIWHFTKSGTFSVKSAYRVGIQFLERRGCVASSSGGFG